MAKQKLEKVLEYLINKDGEKAKALLHQIFVEKAREIHESLMQEDEFSGDEVAEDQRELDAEEMTFEEYFGEDDLDDEDDGEGEEGIEDAEGAADEIANDMMGDEGSEGDDEEVDGAEGEGSDDLAGQIEDLEADLNAKFAEIQSQLTALTGDDADEGEETDDDSEDFGGDDDGEGETAQADDADAEGEDDEETNESASIYGGSEEDVFEELDALLGEDFDDLTESAVDELEKVSVSMTDSTVGKGEKVQQNNVSPIPQRKTTDRVGKAAPVGVKSTEHKGYDREDAPSKKEGTGAKSPRNVVGKSTDGRTKVNKEGDKGAKLNSKDGFGEGNNKSPLGSVGTKGVTK